MSREPASGGTPVAAATQPPQRPHVSLAHALILGGLTAFGPLSTDMYLPALPAVRHDLGATVSLVQVTLTACILGLSLGQLIAGSLSDAYGRRRPLLLGTAAFGLSSLFCALAPSVTLLAALRFLQGLAGAAGVAIALAVARDLYRGAALARCISLLMSVNFLAPIVAPVFGGQLLRIGSWRAVFLALAVVASGLVVASAATLGETLAPDRRRRTGVVGTLRVVRGLVADRRFLGCALSTSFAFAAGMVYISSSPFVLQTLYGLSPQRFSLLFGVNALGLALTAQVGGRIVHRVSPRSLLRAGIILLTAAGASLPLLVLGGLGLVAMLAALFVMVASLGLIAPNAAALALTVADQQATGSAAAVFGVVQLSIGAVLAPLVGLGGLESALPMALGICAFGLLALAAYGLIYRPAASGHED